MTPDDQRAALSQVSSALVDLAVVGAVVALGYLHAVPSEAVVGILSAIVSARAVGQRGASPGVVRGSGAGALVLAASTVLGLGRHS